MNNSQIPVARKDGLVIQESAEEVLVYDLNTNKAHCLNQTAAYVWKSCDGSRSVEEIAKSFALETGVGVQEELIWLAIDQLNGKDLLENGSPTLNLVGQTRRQLIKKVGLAAVIALPVVASLTAPTSVLAASSCTCAGGSGDCLAQPACGPTCNPVGVCVAAAA